MTDTSGDKVKLAIEAPKYIPIAREGAGGSRKNNKEAAAFSADALTNLTRVLKRLILNNFICVQQASLPFCRVAASAVQRYMHTAYPQFLEGKL